MNYLIIVFCCIEIIAHIVAMHELYKILVKILRKKYNSFLQKCVDNVEYRNRFASKIFFFQDMGPSIASFSVISLVIDQSNALLLLIVFLIGYNMKEQSRRFKNIFYKKIEERSQKCQLDQ